MTLEYQPPPAGAKYRKYLLLMGILFVAAAAVWLWPLRNVSSATLRLTSPQRSINQMELWWELSWVFEYTTTNAICAGLLAYVGLGLIRGRRWARIWAIALSAWGFLTSAPDLPMAIIWLLQSTSFASSFARVVAFKLTLQLLVVMTIGGCIFWFLRRAEVISAIHEMDESPSRFESLPLPVFTTAVIAAAMAVGSLLMMPRILLALTTEPGWLSTIAVVRGVTMLILLFATTLLCLSRPKLGWWAALLTLVAILIFSGMNAFVMLRPHLAYTVSNVRPISGNPRSNATRVLVHSAPEAIAFAIGLLLTRQAFAKVPSPTALESGPAFS